MEIEMEGRHKNTLLHREEFNFEILNVKKTPTRKEVREKLASILGADENLVIVDEIDHEFGSTRVVGFAKKYDSTEDLQKIESVHMQKRHEKKDKKTSTKKEETAKGE